MYLLMLRLSYYEQLNCHTAAVSECAYTQLDFKKRISDTLRQAGLLLFCTQLPVDHYFVFQNDLCSDLVSVISLFLQISICSKERMFFFSPVHICVKL